MTPNRYEAEMVMHKARTQSTPPQDRANLWREAKVLLERDVGLLKTNPQLSRVKQIELAGLEKQAHSCGEEADTLVAMK
jgi:hypothetical protein